METGVGQQRCWLPTEEHWKSFAQVAAADEEHEVTGRSTPVRCSPEYCGEPLPHVSLQYDSQC